MAKFRYGLGRGLDSLIPQGTPPEAVQQVDLDLIAPNPEQPRGRFDPETLEELASSIREHGVIQPLLVTRVGGSYQLIAGERRLEAARQAGLTRVPVIVREAAGQGLLELALVENLQRADLSALEAAAAFKRLGDEFGLTQEQIATRVGRSRAAVANTIRLLSLEGEIRESLARGDITEGHARALLGLEDEAARRAGWRRVLEGDLTVRQTEELVRELRARMDGPEASDVPEPTTAPRDPEVEDLERRLMALLSTRVRVSRRRRGARIVIDCYNDEQLLSVVETLLR
jgi:ParB family transcriptional regulator, chromosome partitioning protein